MSNAKKVAVVCANGKAGSLIAREAVERSMEVTAFVRDDNRSAAQRCVSKDVFDITAADLAGFDAVVDAFGAWTPETIPGIPAACKHLADCLAGTDTRLLVVGGAGSLFVNPEHTATVEMGPDFPEDWKPLSSAHGEALTDLRRHTDVKWTYVSPAIDCQAEGARTGEYTLGGEELVLNAAGQSTVSYADYAVAMVDLIESGGYVCERVSVVSK